MIRIATWNIEWFEALFDREDALRADHEWSRRYNVTRAEQADAIATVLAAVDADLVMIIEAPNSGKSQSTLRALEHFAETYGLRQKKAVMGFANDTHQEIAALYDPFVLSARHAPVGLAPGATDGEGASPRFDGEFRLDLDGDGQTETNRFSKPPLELEVHLFGPDVYLRLIGVHAKSRASHGAAGPEEAARLVLANRRKQLAQCVWLRERVDWHLDRGDRLVVLGDFNDGPELVGTETPFGRSSIEVVMGPHGDPEKRLIEPHAAIRLDPRQGWDLSSARFYIGSLKWYVNTLLDYVMVSPGLAEEAEASWSIWHPFDNPACFGDTDLREALLAASDHFPVSVDLFPDE